MVAAIVNELNELFCKPKYVFVAKALSTLFAFQSIMLCNMMLPAIHVISPSLYPSHQKILNVLSPTLVELLTGIFHGKLGMVCESVSGDCKMYKNNLTSVLRSDLCAYKDFESFQP